MRDGDPSGRGAGAGGLGADQRRDLMLRYGNDALLLFDSGYRVVDCNERALDMFGYARDELIGLGIDAVHAEQPDVPLALRQEALRRSDRAVFESVGRRKDGSTFPIETSLHVVRAECLLLYHATVRDITERREAETALCGSEEQYRLLFASMMEGFAYCRMLYDDKGRAVDWEYLSVNPAFARLTGVEDAVGRRVTELLPTIREDNPELIGLYAGVAESGEPTEFDVNFRPLDKWLHVSATSPRKGEFVAVFYDTSERMRAESRAREDELRLHLSLAAADAGTWEWDLTTDENTWSDEIWDLYGLDRAGHEASYASWLESVRPEDRADLEALLSEAVSHSAELDFDWCVSTRDGSVRWLHSHGSPEVDEYGALVRYRGIVMDVTQRHRAEAAAQEERAKLDAALQGMTDAVYIFDARGELVDFNDAYVTVNRFTSRDDCLTSLRDYPMISEVLRPDGARMPLEEWPSSRALRGQIGVDEEFTVRRTDTGETWVGSYSFSPLRGEDGEITGAVVVARDITERKRTERALRESEQRFRSLFESSPLAVFLSSPDGTIAAANRTACELFRCSEGDLRALGRSGILDADDPRLARALEERARTGCLQAVELTAVRKDGERFLVEVDSIILPSDPPQSFIMMRDITERRRAEDALRRSEAEKQTALDAAELGVWWHDLTTGVVRFDERGREHYGFRDAEMPAHAVLALTHPDDRERQAAAIAAVTDPTSGSDERVIEYRIVPPGSPPRWLSVAVRVLFEGEGEDRHASMVYGTTADVTERKQMEQSLRESEAEARETVERLSRAQQLGHIGDWEWEVATGGGRWSDEVYRIYGVDRDFPVTVDAIAAMVHPDERARELACTQAMLDDPERRSGSLQFRIVRPDGSVRHILQTLAIERDDEGKALRAFGLQQDVTELRETEDALVQSEHRLRRIYDAGLVGVAFWTVDGGITDANDRFLEMIGYTRAELESGSIDWAALTPPEWAARDRESLEELRTTGRNAVPFAKEYVRKDGSRLPILTAAAAFDDEGTAGIGLVVDISEQKRAEAELRRLNLQLEDHVRRRTADLEAANAELESFSYSVSHDLRAPLRHISGFSALLREHVQDGDDETRHFLDRIEQAAVDMSVLIDDLLQFSRVGRAEMHVERVDMAALVDDVLEVQRSTLGDRRVDVTIGALPPAMGDRVLLRQVWANLLDNAFKYTRPRDPAGVEVGAREDDGETVYSVRDNGVGFDMLYVDRLFRVFERLHRAEEFEGTGIGLANVGRIVGRHGGRCGAESVQGEGATFWFSLPRAR